MKLIKAGVIGTGYIGQSHIEGLMRLGNVKLVALADTDETSLNSCGDRYCIDRRYRNYADLIADEQVQVVHNCTPNHLHREINLAVIGADKHIFSEKPLGLTSTESAEMLCALAQHPTLVAGINFCYRMTALVQDAKNRIAAGEIGRPVLVHGSYLQDWMLYDTDYNWRAESKYGGPSRAVGDIGSHWMDLAQVMLGAKITEVCAQTLTAHPVRKKTSSQVLTFATTTDAPREDVPIDTEDYAGVLLRFDNGTVGSFSCSQVSAGRKCFIDIEIDGTKASFQWQHQTGDRMWKGNRDKNNEEIMRNPVLMTEAARPYTSLAAGHPEGWNDAFKNTLRMFYHAVQQEHTPSSAPTPFATFEDGHYILLLTEAILKSARERRWVQVGNAVQKNM